MRIIALLTILPFAALSPAAADMEWVKVSDDNKGFVLSESRKPFVPWGFNYDHEGDGKLIEDYWDEQWPTVESAFREMKELGANVVRIHLQFGKFMESPTKPRPSSLDQLTRLVKFAEQIGLYLDVTGLGCYHKRDVPPWYDKLSEQERWQAQVVFWEAVAKTCAESPAIFCYDLMNEPVVAGGDKKRNDWLGPGFGDKHFVQYITLDREGRERPEIAQEWIRILVSAIRTHDKRHSVTVGLVPWSLDRPGLTSGFVPEKIADDLDFIAVHIYPETGKMEEAIETLKGFAAVGKPVVIEEIFPLKCDAKELGRFIDQSRQHATGWIGFYWGKTPAEIRPAKTIPEAITLSWLELFEEKTPQILGKQAKTNSFLNNGVTAHRGNSGDFPENTLPAFESGIEVGADWIELDIFRTKDGKLVVIHDRTTARTGDKNLGVTDSTYENLLTVDVATDFRNRTGKTIDNCPAQTIPLLEDVLRLVMKQNRTRISIQPKMDCVAEAVALVKSLKAERWVGFNDGNLQYMADVKRLAPEIPVFWDRGADTNIEEDIRIAHQHGFEALVLHHSGVTPEKVRKIKAAGLEVGAWTVNDGEAMEKLLNMGVQRLYTDHPRRLLALKAEDQPPAVSFHQGDGRLQIVIGDQQIAEYVFEDDKIRRPYFRHLRTLSGVQVTRNHPPVPGQDLDDHPTMHPGLWLAFGDLNAADFWRNKGRVRHIRYVEPPKGKSGSGSFTVQNAYEADREILCTENCEITISVQTNGYLLDWTSTFRSENGDITFGDQEEMGLGVRMATPLAVVKGGTITDSKGRKNEPQVWGQQADWCEYSGVVDGKQVGVVLMPNPKNFRPSWFHARNYGLLVANPFGQNAFTKSDKSRVAVNQGDEFKLRFGVLVYEGNSPEIDVAYREYVK